jgi:hypothetical protein
MGTATRSNPSSWYARVPVTLACVAVVVGAVTLFAPSIASGQQDPYTSSTVASSSTTEAPCVVDLQLSVEVGPAGVRVNARAICYDVNVHVDITFNGVIVGGGDTKTASGTGLGSNRLAALSPVRLLAAVGRPRAVRAEVSPANGVDVSFLVPPVPPGNYAVCAVSPGYPTACEQFQVLAAGSAARGGSSGSSFARTGLRVLPFVFVALLLVAAGRVLVSRSRSRSRAGV